MLGTKEVAFDLLDRRICLSTTQLVELVSVHWLTCGSPALPAQPPSFLPIVPTLTRYPIRTAN